MERHRYSHERATSLDDIHGLSITDERVRGVARDSNARRRSHLVWAPAHKNFLLKILAPPFASSITDRPESIAEHILFDGMPEPRRRRGVAIFQQKNTRPSKRICSAILSIERVRGVEPLTSPWKGDVIPLYNTRVAPPHDACRSA